MDTIYLVEASSGSYDDYVTWPVCWYATREEADARCARFNTLLAVYDNVRYAQPYLPWFDRVDFEQYRRDEVAHWTPHLATLRALAQELSPATYETDEELLRCAWTLASEHHAWRVRDLQRGA